MKNGAHIKKSAFRWRCQSCVNSLEPGWLWMPGNDYVECPNCRGGWITGEQTEITPTRKIILPARVTP